MAMRIFGAKPDEKNFFNAYVVKGLPKASDLFKSSASNRIKSVTHIIINLI